MQGEVCLKEKEGLLVRGKRENGGFMKIHRLLADACVELLDLVLRGKEVLDHELNRVFMENPRWGKRDRGFVAETVFEIVRGKSRWEFLAGASDTAALCAAFWQEKGWEIPSWWAFPAIEENRWNERVEAWQARPWQEQMSAAADVEQAFLANVPEERAQREWEALNAPARIFLRVNLLKGTVEETQQWLAAEGVETEPVEGVPAALALCKGRVPKPILASGRVEIQDIASQQIVPFLQLEEGNLVLDACCGAGGKTLQMASEMGNRVKLFGVDVSEKQLMKAEQRAPRAGVRASFAKWTEEIQHTWQSRADRVLIDTPCSGMGTLRRQPDLKWRTSRGRIESLTKQQLGILEKYAELVKVGGLVVYATCSVLRCENRAIVDAFLAKNPGFSLEQERQFWPSEGGDGLYAAQLRRNA